MKRLLPILAACLVILMPAFPVSPAIVDQGDSTLLDDATQLLWQQSAGPSLNWNSAVTYCGDSTLAGQSAWRVPILTELQNLIDDAYDPEINPLFEITRGGFTYWSFTDFTSSSDILSERAYAVSFIDGFTLDSPKGTSHRVRCVTDYTCNATWQGQPVTWQGVCHEW